MSVYLKKFSKNNLWGHHNADRAAIKKTSYKTLSHQKHRTTTSTTKTVPRFCRVFQPNKNDGGLAKERPNGKKTLLKHLVLCNRRSFSLRTIALLPQMNWYCETEKAHGMQSEMLRSHHIHSYYPTHTWTSSGAKARIATVTGPVTKTNTVGHPLFQLAQLQEKVPVFCLRASKTPSLVIMRSNGRTKH